MNTINNMDDVIASYTDWRGERLTNLRTLINDSGLGLSEDFKWGTAVWTYNGKLVCAISGFKGHVKINFFKGANLPDPLGVFNSGLDSKQHRSINFAEQDTINDTAIRGLLLSAVQK